MWLQHIDPKHVAPAHRASKHVHSAASSRKHGTSTSSLKHVAPAHRARNMWHQHIERNMWHQHREPKNMWHQHIEPETCGTSTSTLTCSTSIESLNMWHQHIEPETCGTSIDPKHVALAHRPETCGTSTSSETCGTRHIEPPKHGHQHIEPETCGTNTSNPKHVAPASNPNMWHRAPSVTRHQNHELNIYYVDIDANEAIICVFLA
ncbi:hypothetical protein CEXT_32051, partial [Caerostris extrusa]